MLGKMQMDVVQKNRVLARIRHRHTPNWDGGSWILVGLACQQNGHDVDGAFVDNGGQGTV